MTPGISLPKCTVFKDDSLDSSVERLSAQIEHNDDSVPVHPLRLKPLGNAYNADLNLKHALGKSACLPDEIIVSILESLDPISLLRFGSTCKGAFAFSAHDELWKSFCLGLEWQGRSWRGSWRSSFLDHPTSSIDCNGMYSDVLYRPFHCAKLDLTQLYSVAGIRNPIPVVTGLDETTFAAEWCNRPFILTGVVETWPIYQDWTLQKLQDRHGSIVFRAEALDWPLNTYVHYMRNNSDESPLYLFDRAFRQKMSLDIGAYTKPACFGVDLFDALGGDRPDFAWLIVGSEHSGSTFHKDPNATSAWNAVIRGRKYWIMFPPEATPPGVFVSDDQSEVTSPLSIGEWILGFLDRAKKTPGCVEGICNEGQLLHVPSGWWHLVVNLEETIAVTQNFVPPSHLNKVFEFLEHKSEQVSGFSSNIASPYELFRSQVTCKYPGLLERVKEDESAVDHGKKRKWGDFVGLQGSTDTSSKAGFNFAFEDDSDDTVF